MGMDRVQALFILAWALVRSLLAPLLGKRRGLADFERSYGPDRLPALSLEERDLVTKMGGCIACGLCNVGEGAAMTRSKGAYRGVMDLMLASSRSMPDYDAALRSFDAVSDARLGELEGRCPAHVPMRRVAAFVRAKAAQMQAAPSRR
jgi:succinate dehydrogenase/fumarate reductase-like Fe-S protein